MSYSSTFYPINRWVAPGIFLLGKSRVTNRDILAPIKDIFMSHCGVWVFVHGDECVVIEAPFHEDDSGPVVEALQGFLQSHHLRVKVFTATHLHLDHAAGLDVWCKLFGPEKLVAPQNWKTSKFPFDLAHEIKSIRPRMMQDALNQRTCHIYRGHQVLDLCGETVHFLETPYHSLTDQTLVFRGHALLSDWHLPSFIHEQIHLVDCSPEEIGVTINNLAEVMRNYRIHSRIPVHAENEWNPVLGDFEFLYHNLRRKYNFPVLI